MTDSVFSKYTEPFSGFPKLKRRLKKVMSDLPKDIQSELLQDPNFKVTLDDFEPGRGRIVLMPDLGPDGGSRCVVLKPRLELCSDAFACYIIAHEFAHAYLYNRGWKEINDPEQAADALAATWGYRKQPYEFV